MAGRRGHRSRIPAPPDESPTRPVTSSSKWEWASHYLPLTGSGAPVIVTARLGARRSTMAWQVSSDHFETCACDYVCPCLPSNGGGR